MKRLSILCVAGVIALAGCGGGGDSSSDTGADTGAASTEATETSSGGGGALSLKADESQLKFDKSTLSASAGKVTITMENPSSLQHDVAIEGNGIDEKGETVGQGGTSTVSADLKAGEYTFYCSVDSHADAGMKGTLTVK